MKIVHCCLACSYIDDYGYQENILPILNKEDGHEVFIVASTETFVQNLKLGYVKPSSYITREGIPIVRLPYKRVFTNTVTRKLRCYKGLLTFLEKIKPNVIMLHDMSFYSLKDIIKYKQKNPEVVIFADTHTASYNSGQNWLSLNILHRIVYKRIIQQALPYVKKIFFIGKAEKDFSVTNYLIPEKMMEFFPLGGILIGDEEYNKLRKQYRDMLGVDDYTSVFVHSGKMDALKKTGELISAFSRVKELNAKLVIIGTFIENEKECMDLIKADNRIVFLGWRNQQELQGYLCASDMYCQPGSPSATMQKAICCRNPIMAYPTRGYDDFDCGNIIWVETEADVERTFRNISCGLIELNSLKEKTMICARDVLDYKKMARKLTDF